MLGITTIEPDRTIKLSTSVVDSRKLRVQTRPLITLGYDLVNSVKVGVITLQCNVATRFYLVRNVVRFKEKK